MLSFVPGAAIHPDHLHLIASLDGLRRAARLIADYHDAQQTFRPPSDARWRDTVAIPPAPTRFSPTTISHRGTSSPDPTGSISTGISWPPGAPLGSCVGPSLIRWSLARSRPFRSRPRSTHRLVLRRGQRSCSRASCIAPHGRPANRAQRRRTVIAAPARRAAQAWPGAAVARVAVRKSSMSWRWRIWSSTTSEKWPHFRRTNSPRIMGCGSVRTWRVRIADSGAGFECDSAEPLTT